MINVVNRLVLRIVAASLSLTLLLTGEGQAQLTTVWKGGTGDWNTAANWTVGVPSTGINAQIDHLINTNSSVSLSANGSVKNLTIDSGDQLDLAGHTLNMQGASLTLNGAMTASGPLSFTSAGGATISGTGTLTATNNISATGVPFIIGNGNTINLNSAGATGPYGQIHASSLLSNNGTIVAGLSNQADIVATAISNSGTMTSSGAALSLRSALIENDGLLEAEGNGSLINLNSDNFPNGVQVSGSGGWSIDDGGLNGLGVIAIQTTGEFHVSGLGVATLGSGSSLSASVMSGDGTISCPSYALNILDGDANKPFSGSLGTGARLVKTGAGTQVITSEQVYTGGTLIQGGKLEVDNPNAHGSGVGFGELDVENGGTLTGTGGASSFSFVKSGGTLAPGSIGAGTFSFFGLTLESGSKLSLDLGDGVPSDLVRVYDSAFAAEGVNVEINDVGLKKGVTTWFADWTGALILQAGGIVPADFALVNTPGIAGVFVIDNTNSRVGFTPLALPLYGDYNGNGIVDAADYTVWRDTLGQSVAKGSGADGNHDGSVSEDDYFVWRNNFGQTAPLLQMGRGSEVPEPATIVLLTAGLFAVGGLGYPLDRRRLGRSPL